MAFQLAALSEHVASLPTDRDDPHRRPEERLTLATLTAVRLADIDSLAAVDAGGLRGKLDALLRDLDTRLPALAEALARQYLSHAISSRQLSGPPSAENA